jgi:hypothetical protein
MQQQRQRVVGGMAPGDLGMGPGGSGITVADGEQPVGDGMAAARLTPLAPLPFQPFRRAPQSAHDRPRQHRGDDGDAQRQREHRQRRFDAPAAP